MAKLVQGCKSGILPRYTQRCKEMTVLQESVRVLTNRLAGQQKDGEGKKNSQDDGVVSVPLNTTEGMRRVPKRINSSMEGEGAPPTKVPRRALHNTPHNQTF